MFSAQLGRAPEGLNPQWQAMLDLRAEGKKVLDLTLSNPTAAGLAYPPGIPSLFAKPGVMAYQPHPQGDAEAREAVCGYYRGQGRACHADDLFLTASTSEAYSFLFKLLCSPGDEALIPSPSYPLFDALADLEHVKLLRYPVRLSGPEAPPRWRPDLAFLRSIVSTRSRALILVNPNNPTGQLADAGEIAAYLDLAREYGLALIVDEVFCDYALGARPFLPVASDGPLVFTLNGFSKMLGLPQAKLAWIHVAGESALRRRAHAGLEWIADAFLSVGAPVQKASGDLLALRPALQGIIRSRLQANLAIARELALTHPGLGFLAPEAGWALVLDLDCAEPDEAFTLSLLREKGVQAHPGSWFGFADGCHLVLGLLTPEAEFRAGLAGIAAHLEARRG